MKHHRQRLRSLNDPSCVIATSPSDFNFAFNMDLDIHPLRRILTAVNGIQQACQDTTFPLKVVPLKGTGRQPRLPLPEPDWPHRLEGVDGLSPREHGILITRAQEEAKRCRSCILSAFRETISRMTSVERLGLGKDSKVEEELCRVHERLYGQQMLAIEGIVSEVVNRLCRRQSSDSRKSTFSAVSSSRDGVRRAAELQRTLNVLEAAFVHSDSLTPAECALVSQAAGITHEQVGRRLLGFPFRCACFQSRCRLAFADMRRSAHGYVLAPGVFLSRPFLPPSTITYPSSTPSAAHRSTPHRR